MVEKQTVVSKLNRVKMTERSNGKYVMNGQSILNRCKRHKKNHSTTTKMLNASGFGFDNTTKRIIALDDVWKAWIGVSLSQGLVN